jgi:hypothetical protein
MKLFKNTNKLIFIVISFVINISFSIAAVAATDNQQNYGKNRVYLGYNNTKQDEESKDIVSAEYTKYGLEFFCNEHSKLKLEGFTGKGKGIIDYSRVSDFEIDYFYAGLEHYYQNYIGAIAFKSLDIGGNQWKTIGYTAGCKGEFADIMYIKPTLTMEYIMSEKTASAEWFSTVLTLKAKNKFLIDPKIAIGANIEVPNTTLSINPEVYFSPRAVGASINFDINTFFVKLETNLNARIKDSPINNTALTFGVNF